jgi:hypothetical protein
VTERVDGVLHARRVLHVASGCARELQVALALGHVPMTRRDNEHARCHRIDQRKPVGFAGPSDARQRARRVAIVVAFTILIK